MSSMSVINHIIPIVRRDCKNAQALERPEFSTFIQKMETDFVNSVSCENLGMAHLAGTIVKVLVKLNPYTSMTADINFDGLICGQVVRKNL